MTVARATPLLRSAQRVRVDGEERLVMRHVALTVHPDLRCPEGHQLSVSDALEEHAYRCRHRRGDGSTCNRILYVMADWSSETERLVLAVEVTSDELRRMRRWRPRVKLEYLSLMWPTPTGNP